MLRLRIIGTLVAFATTAALATAAVELPRRKDRWLEVRSENFSFFSSAGERATRRVAADLEELRAVLAKITDLELNSPAPVLVYLFKNDQSFTPYKHLYLGKPAASSGFFVQRDHANYIAFDARSSDDDSRIVYHEYVHYFSSTNLPYLPLWFEEGLAEVYQGFRVAGDKVRLGLAIPQHIIRLRSSPLLSLDELFEVDHASRIYNERDRKSIFYSQSWALVHYLLIGSDERRPETLRFVSLLIDGVPQAEAFAQAYSVNIEELWAGFRRYIDRSFFPYLQTTASVSVDTTMSIREMSYPDVLYHLGDLLAQEEPLRLGVADHFQKATEIDPDHGPSLAALGLLAEQRARWDEARSFYRRAMNADPDDPTVLYRGGTFLLRRGGDVEQARMALRRSTEINPSFGPAWVALTGSYMAAGEFTDRAVSAAETAHRLFPSRTDVAANLLRLYLESDRRDRALDLTRRAFSADPSDRATARGVIARHDLRAAREAIANRGTEAARQALFDAESVVGGASGEEQLRQRISLLRDNIEDLEITSRYNEAAALYNDDRVDEARRILLELQGELPEGRHAKAVRDFLEFLENPESEGKFEANQTMLSDASPGEIDRLNELLALNEFEQAVTLLEELDQRVSRDQETWIDLKIRELWRVIEHNRFVEAYNTAVKAFNGGAYAAAVATLERLLTAQPDAAQADDARQLLAEARAELTRQ